VSDESLDDDHEIHAAVEAPENEEAGESKCVLVATRDDSSDDSLPSDVERDLIREEEGAQKNSIMASSDSSFSDSN
jgi:hypothetical protein